MKEALENELNGLSPHLAELKKRQAGNPFKTPKFYFDTLTDTVLAEAKKSEKIVVTTTKGTPQYKKVFERFEGYFSSIFSPKLALAFASSALILAAGWYVFSGKTRENEANQPQIIVNQSPYSSQPLPSVVPNIEQNTNIVPPQISGLKDVKKEDIDAYINENVKDFDVPSIAENDQKRSDTEGSSFVHPQSKLTEEELETYLSNNIEDGDLDIIDNNF